MKNLHKKISGVIFILAAVAIFIWLIAAGPAENQNPPGGAWSGSAGKSEIQTQSEETQLLSAKLDVEGVFYDLKIEEGSAVLQLMEQAQSEHGFVFESDESDAFGAFITSINDIESNTETNEYWSYYINGNLAEVGVSGYIVEEGDVISWKYEKIEF